MLNVSKGKKCGPHCNAVGADSAAMRCCTHLNLGQRWRQRSTGFHQGGLIWAFAQEFHPPCLQVIDATLDLHFTRSNLPQCEVCACDRAVARSWLEGESPFTTPTRWRPGYATECVLWRAPSRSWNNAASYKKKGVVSGD